MLCPSTASLGFDNMHIQGSGTISADHTSLDIHLEITNVNDSQPSAPSAPAPSAPASTQSTEKAVGPYTAKYQQDLPFFGVETGKCIYISARVFWEFWTSYGTKTEGRIGENAELRSDNKEKI